MKPIGYWLKHLDGLIEAGFDRALGDVSRRHWQVLNVLASGPQTLAGLKEALAPFSPGSALDELAALGWVSGEPALTPVGREAHARIAQRVEVVRDRLVDGLGPEDYPTVIRVLSRMAENLEPHTLGVQPPVSTATGPQRQWSSQQKRPNTGAPRQGVFVQKEGSPRSPANSDNPGARGETDPPQNRKKDSAPQNEEVPRGALNPGPGPTGREAT